MVYHPLYFQFLTVSNSGISTKCSLTIGKDSIKYKGSVIKVTNIEYDDIEDYLKVLDCNIIFVVEAFKLSVIIDNSKYNLNIVINSITNIRHLKLFDMLYYNKFIDNN